MAPGDNFLEMIGYCDCFGFLQHSIECARFFINL